MDNNTQGGAWSFDPTSLAGDVGVSALQPIMDRTTEREKAYTQSAAGSDFFVNGTYTRAATAELANFNISDYSIVGMNATKAKDVAAKINATVDKNLIPLVQQISTDSSRGFKGEAAETAFNDYVNNVKTYIENLISDLKAFSDKIYEVGDLYAASDKSLAGKISSSAGFAGTAYNPSRATATSATGYGNSFINENGKKIVPLEHDLDGDGKVTSEDARVALQNGDKELGEKILGETMDLDVGNSVLEGTNSQDLNGDGMLDAKDATQALADGNDELGNEILNEYVDSNGGNEAPAETPVNASVESPT